MNPLLHELQWWTIPEASHGTGVGANAGEMAPQRLPVGPGWSGAMALPPHDPDEWAEDPPPCAAHEPSFWWCVMWTKKSADCQIQKHPGHPFDLDAGRGSQWGHCQAF